MYPTVPKSTLRDAEWCTAGVWIERRENGEMLTWLASIQWCHTTDHSDLPSNISSFRTSQFGPEMHELFFQFNSIWQHYRFARIDGKIRNSNILHSLTSMIVFIIVSYNRHCRFWMNFSSNKRQKPSLVLVLRGYTLCGIRGQNVSFFFLKKFVFLMK